MRYQMSPWGWLLCAILGLRVVSMAWYPLAGTSEPRYAEIARLMVSSGDWITPWFAPDIPFWGKPPLSFWSEALAFKLLGINEFAARLPSWLATLGTLFLVHVYARSHFGGRAAQWAVVIYSSCALVFVAAGAVLTDPFLVFATTWAMVAFAMVSRQPAWQWRYGFFVAMAIGLLAKGPLILVLVAGPLIPVLMGHPSARNALKQLPWWSGLALMLALSLPWYVLAELKTPGFLDYFLIGEHFLRFVNSGWRGDLYGTAHREMKGTIWIHVLVASFPWGIAAIAMLLRRLADSERRASLWQLLQKPEKAYLLAWTLFTPVFFTFSGNVLWTYVLPALPAFSILLGHALSEWNGNNNSRRVTGYVLACLTPLVVTGYMVLTTAQPQRMKTEKSLVAYAVQHMQPGDKLAYLDSVPFSARFYSRGQAGLITWEDLATKAQTATATYLAVPKSDFETLSKMIDTPLPSLFESREFVLTFIPHNAPAFRMLTRRPQAPLEIADPATR